ncbi:MAG TPA: hypothetical protein VK465_04125, partial [Fibrobacteria bacterium]|nr:hypothetical protein [Fibrobacteria bacterium]
VATAGPGVLLSTYPYFGQDSVQSAPLTDRIAPVLLQAVMLPGTSSDTLRLVFSEPINTGAITAASADLFIYRLSQAGADLHFPSSGVNWNSTRDTAFVIFQAGSADAPRSGNLVRIADGAGRLADAAGNGAGPNSRFRLITGLKQAAVLTETFITVDPAKANLVPAPILVSLEARTQTVKQLVEKSGRLGHLVKVDLGDYAQADDFTPVDPSQVFLEYQVAYFDNHAVPVAKETRMISCQDPIFNGDCRATRGYLFVSWNFTTLKQQRVATGAYVARFRYKVTVAGKAAVSGALDQVWGVLRSH